MEKDAVFTFFLKQKRVLCWDKGQFCLVFPDGKRFSLVYFDIRTQIFLMRWGTVQTCLFRYKNAKLSVGMGNGGALSVSM